MKWTMPHGFGVLGAVVAGMMLMCLSQAAAQEAAGESQEPTRQARSADAIAVRNIPVLVDRPESTPEHAAGFSSRPERSRTPGQQRTIAILARHETIPSICKFATARRTNIVHLQGRHRGRQQIDQIRDIPD